MTREQLVDGGLHNCRILVQEAAGGVGDAGEVVADLVGHDTLDRQRDRLVPHGVDDQASSAGVQTQPAPGVGDPGEGSG